MIKCKRCGHGFLSTWRETYPGGAETGVTVLFRGIGLLSGGLLLCGIGYLLSVRAIYIFAVLLSLMGVLKISMIRDNRRTIKAHHGHECPDCGMANELKWYD